MTEPIRQYGSDLLRALDYRVPIPPLSSVAPDATINDAYAIQVDVLAARLGRNDPIIGAKVSVHDRSPVFGLYTRSSLMGTFEVADLSQLIQPRVQPVLVLRLLKEIAGNDITTDNVRAATESMVAGIEVTDCRLADMSTLTDLDCIADNVGIAKVIVGEHGIDITQASTEIGSRHVRFTVDGHPSGPPPRTITDPLAAVTALANHLGSQGGKLEKDWFVVIGPLQAPAPVRVGSKVELSIEGMAPVRLRAR